MAWALRVGADITPATKLVLLGLADHAHQDGSHAWPSVGRLARYANISQRQTRRCLRELEDLGLIEPSSWQPTHVRADRRPVCYQLAVRLQSTTGHDVTPHDDPVENPPPRADTDVLPRSSDQTRGDIGDTHGGTPMSAEPSLEPTTKRRAREDEYGPPVENLAGDEVDDELGMVERARARAQQQRRTRRHQPDPPSQPTVTRP